jgi:hypothetical protein
MTRPTAELFLEATAFDENAINKRIDELWPEGDDVEISNESALELLAHIVKWNHARLQPLLAAAAEVVRAASEVPDAEHGELKDALARLREVCEGRMK